MQKHMEKARGLWDNERGIVPERRRTENHVQCGGNEEKAVGS